MYFTKVHGLGNDFVLLDCLERGEEKIDFPSLARKICDRHFGIGADGLVLILPSDNSDIRMRIFNPDGSEPEMCGNAIRCFAKYIYERGIVQDREIKVETLAGTIIPEVLLDGNRVTAVRVNMGQPRLERREVPMLGTGSPVVDEPLLIEGKEYRATCLSMGNPHCVIFVPRVDEVQVPIRGPLLERHPSFPRKTNVEFVEVLGPAEMRMFVWERGAGETLACGTGACAVGVAGVLTGRTDREVTVHLAGGDLRIYWSASDNCVYMTGPAEEVFHGEYLIEK
ncbi:MAG: diaminopimelate epimerase [Bacillota bacterium]